MSNRSPLRFSFHILFIGWWMMGQRQLSKGQNHQKLSLSMSPRSPINLGAKMMFLCRSKNEYGSLYLIKRSSTIYYLMSSLGMKDSAVFEIASAQESHGGIYKCIYCFQDRCNLESNAIEVTIRGQLSAKPSISVTPTVAVVLGETSVISCQTKEQSNAQFTLQKQGDSDLSDIEGRIMERGAAFTINRVRQIHAGIYQCRYCLSISSFLERCSEFSDSIDLIIIDPSLLRPFIRVKSWMQVTSSLLNVTFECQGQEPGLNFSLLKSGELIDSRAAKADGNISEFLVSTESMGEPVNYTCQYHRKTNPFVWSEPSDPVDSRDVAVRGESRLALWLSIVVGLILLLLLVLLVFLVYRKRGRGSTDEKSQPTNKPIELYEEIHPDGLCYAELEHSSQKIKQAGDQDRPQDTCVYAAVVQRQNFRNVVRPENEP